MDIDISEDEDQARLLIDGYLREQPTISQHNSFFDIRKIIQIFYYIPGIINLNSPTPTPEPMTIDIENNSNETTTNIPDPIKSKNINKLLKSIDPSIILIDGYIRELTKTINISISSVIIDLIQSFYQKMKGTTFVWEITDEKKLLTKILESNKLSNNNNNSKGFDSDVFETITPLKQPTSNMPICGNCGKISNNLKRCSGCKQIYYCSRNCQYNHWDNSHGNICAPGPPPLLDYTNTNNNNISNIFDSNLEELEDEKLDNLSLKWYIKLYANGMDFDSLGHIELELILVSLPSILESVSFIYQVYCDELSLYWSSQLEFNNDETRHCLSESINGNNSISLLNDLQILKEMGKLKRLRFYCTFNVIRCGMKNNINTNINSSQRLNRGYKYKYNPIYYFDERKYLKSIGLNDNTTNNINIDEILGDFLMQNNEFKFKWDINSNVISNLVHSINIDHPKCVISDLYFNQWCLSLHYKKINVSKVINESKDEEKDDNKSEVMENKKNEIINEQNQFTIGLELLSLPSNISSFVAQIKLFCLQFSSQWSIVKKFSYNNRYYNDLIINNISLNNGTNINKLSIFVDIKIIEVFDEFGDEQQIKIKQIKQKYKQQIIKSHKPMDTFNINYNEKIIGDLNMRYHFKHLCLQHDKLEQISNEELRFEDENSPKWAKIKYTNNINNININGMQSSLIYNKSSNYYIKPLNNSNKRGTIGYDFIPFIQKGKQKKQGKKATKIFYYQHICINNGLNNPFKEKQNEELQFEDTFQSNNNNSWDKLFGVNKNDKNGNNNTWSWAGNNNENNSEINSGSNTPNTQKNGRLGSPIGSPGTKIMNGKNPYQLCHESLNGNIQIYNNGSLVQINGLRGTIAKYNGKKGKILSFDETKMKYKIKLLNGVNDKKRNYLHLKANNLLLIKENKIMNEKEKGLKEFKTDWKFNTNEWIWDSNKRINERNDEKENELNIDIMKNKIEFMTTKLEQITDIMYKLYECNIISEENENKNEINKMFDELKDMNDNNNNIKKNKENNKKQIELRNWLENELDLVEYYELFIDEGIDDLNILKLVSYEQLKEIGVRKLGHRLKILQKVKETTSLSNT